MTQEPYIVFGHPYIGAEEIAAVTDTLRTSWIGTGPRVHELEGKIAEYTGAQNAVALASCTAALHLSMIVSGVGPGDEVVTTPLTFAASANAIVHTGATPVFVDVERDTMNIDAGAIEMAVTKNTKAILPVHLTGRPCDMDTIGKVAEDHGLTVIEDAAHALGASYKGMKIGSISPLTCFSFYVTKNLTTAEGGMVTTEDVALAESIKIYGLHGLSADAWERFGDQGYKHYEVVFPGYKYNMTDINASLGLAQFDRLDGWLERRNELWARYDDAFADLPARTPAPAEPDTVHARHLYTLLVDLDQSALDRDQLMLALHERGVGTGVHYRSIHLHDYYKRRFGFAPEDFPNARWISDRTVSLPLSGKLDDSQADRVIKAVREVLGGT